MYIQPHQIQPWLERLLAEHDAVAGSVHLLADGVLTLAAAVRIPEKVQQAVLRVPRGKGMAGLAWERDEPVQTCNLQAGDSADVQPGAKAVDAKGAVALPVHGADGAVRAVVGLAFADERTLGEAQLAALMQAASTLPG